MPLNTKIALSDKEVSLIGNTEWILLKYDIMSKISGLFADCSNFICSEIISSYRFPESALNNPPKISKGENYKHLPYLVLDYPRFFDRQDVFAIRTVFWWGNFISINLHVAGNCISFIDLSSVEKQSDKEFPLYMSVADSQWEHHFGEDNYILSNNLSEDYIKSISQKGFLKFALKFDLTDFGEMAEQLEKGYKQIAELLFSCPSDKKDL